MGLHNGFIIAVLGGLMAASAGYAQVREHESAPDDDDDEKAIERSALPPSVERTVAAEAAHAVVKGFSRERENGRTYYEAEFVVDGHSRDILMDEQGNIVEVEEQVTFEMLPAKVLTAIKARARGGTIDVVESLTKKGKLVAYEAHIKTAGTNAEIQVGPNGETLDHEE